MSESLTVFRDDFDVAAAIEATREQGYYFGSDSLTHAAKLALAVEIDFLPLEVGDHITKPINAGKPNQIQQQHARGYYAYGDPAVPAANAVLEDLTRVVQTTEQFPELRAWQPSEVGYQRYRPSVDFIGPHRDRLDDQLLSVTFTIVGSAVVKIFKTTGKKSDYTKLEQTDEFETESGSVMMLRAPGLGNGEQIVHQVLPPSTGHRDILNLRMRPNVLGQPTSS
jgi:hypothetical protein